jgi:hypothetical protein
LETDSFKKALLDMKQVVTNRINAIDRDIRHEGMTADWSEQASGIAGQQLGAGITQD